MQVIPTFLAKVACHHQQKSLSISCPYKNSGIEESYKNIVLLASSHSTERDVHIGYEVITRKRIYYTFSSSKN